MIDDPTFILDFINQSKSTKFNKDRYGEVFTPAVLINEILDNLPTHLWKNLDLKWLDPCAGRGNFFLLVYGRLMTGLVDSFPNDSERKNHILSKMLYMNDLNRKNTEILRSIFGKKANIHCLDFLKISADNNPFVSLFDVILENPPYQISKKATYKGGRGNNHTLWNLFIEKSFEILADDGYIGAITPANWRRPGHPLYHSLIAPNLKYLHIYGKKDGIRLFGAQTRFDLYILGRKKDLSITPLIIDEMGVSHNNIVPLDWEFLPNYSYSTVKRFFSLKTSRKGAMSKRNILYDSNEYNSKNLSKRRTSKAIYPVVHTMTKKGLGVRWTLKKKGHFGIPKVLLNFNEKLYPYNDWKGEYGMSQLTFGIPIKTRKEGEALVEKINTPEFKEAIRATKWGSFQTDYKMFVYMR